MRTFRSIPILLLLCLTCAAGRTQQLQLADSLLEVGAFPEAAAAYTRVLQAPPNSITPLQRGNSFLRRGNCFNNTGKYDAAIADFFNALSIFEQTGNVERIAAVCNNIAHIYYLKSDFTTSRKYYDRAYSGFTALKDTVRAAESLNNLALIEYESGDYRTAIRMHRLVLDSFPESVPKDLLARHYLNMGSCYLSINKDSAIGFYQLARNMALAAPDSFLLPSILNNLGDVFKEKGNYPFALDNLRQSLFLIPDYGDSTELVTVYHNLGELYHLMGKNDSAYLYSTLERDLNAGLFNTEKNRIALELSEKYESDKKDEKIRTQGIENQLKSRNLILAIAGLVLVSLLGLVLYRNYRKKNEANRLLKEKNERIEKLNTRLDESNQVKSKLFSVIAHDLRAPISSLYAFLHLQQQGGSRTEPGIVSQVSEQTETLLETLEDLLVWSKSQLHQFVPDPGKTDIRHLVQTIIPLYNNEALNRSLEIQNYIPEGTMVLADNNMLTILLRNILTNAVRYSPPASVIRVEAHSGEQCVISVLNEAVSADLEKLIQGIPGELSSSSHGLGTVIIREFAQKLNGHFEILLKDNVVHASLSLPHYS